MELRGDEITALLLLSRAGDKKAGDRLLGCIYADLRRIARTRLRGERADTLETTGLVHEAWLSMERAAQASFESRERFFSYASRAMRHILVDRARQRIADKRQVDDGFHESSSRGLDLAMLDQALARLGALSPRLARVVEFRLLGGLTHVEIAATLGVTERTVERDWLKARALLSQWLEPA